PLPTLVICELLGVPYRDHAFFQQANSVLVSRDCTPEQAKTARLELQDYLDSLVEAKEREPGDDLISRLVIEQVRPGHLTRAELCSTAVLLLLAGHEPTSNMISLGVLALLQHPEQLAELRDSDDPKVAANAVEELLRYLTIGHSGVRRVAMEDVELNGQIIRAGEGVVLLGDAANRDEAVFDDPGRLDIHRQARHHISFGHGIHQCLGASLTRTELQIVYPTLLRRIPGLRTAIPLEEIPFRHDMAIYGVHELPVTW
ncbi:cytochrome P450, partial [Streptomyces phyllanthi]